MSVQLVLFSVDMVDTEVGIVCKIIVSAWYSYFTAVAVLYSIVLVAHISRSSGDSVALKE